MKKDFNNFDNFRRKNEELQNRPNFDSDYNPFDERIMKETPKRYNDQEKDLVFILKRLQPVRPVARNLGIMIPDTAAYQNCETKFIIYTQKVSIFSRKINEN